MSALSSAILFTVIFISLEHLQHASAELKWCPRDIHMTPTTGETGTYNVRYGDPLEMTCTANASTLTMNKEGKKLPTEEVNATTIRWFEKQPELQLTHLQCIDFSTNCTNEVLVMVSPKLQVLSPYVRRDDLIIVQQGDPLELLCTGPEEANLTISHFKAKLPTQTINKTTIRYLKSEPEIQNVEYLCSSYGVSFDTVYVVVDAPPQAVGFRCISDHLDLLNCAWTALSERTNFTLYYVVNKRPVKICAKRAFSAGIKICAWSSQDNPGYPDNVKMLPFVMQACNDLGCSNETFAIDPPTIVKPASPQNLRVLNITSRSVALEWDVNNNAVFANPLAKYRQPTIDHKVQFWFSGIDQRDANTSRLHCDTDILTMHRRRGYLCEATLDLPCPGKNYKLWIHIKPTPAVGEEYWSEPASISFSTDAAGDASGVVDPICEWEPKETKDVMVYLINNFKRELRRDLQVEKPRVDLLKDKLARIRTMKEKLGKR